MTGTLAQSAAVLDALALRPPLRPQAPTHDELAPAPAALDDWPVPFAGAGHAPEVTADMLPGWLGRYVEAVAASTQTPVTMSALFALSVLAACVQRRYVVAPHGLDGDYREPASLWSLSVAASGSRKTAIVNAFTRPLMAWEKRAGDKMRRAISANTARRIASDAIIKRLQGEAGKASDASELDAIRKRIEDEQNDRPDELFPPRLFTGDVTVERLQSMLVEQGGRMAVASDEGGLFATLAGTYGGGAGPSLDALLQGHAGGAVRVDRTTRTAYIDRAAVTLGLMLQPDLLNDAAGSSRFRASGLMARFLFAVPRPFVGGRNVRAFTSVAPELQTEYAREVDALLPDPEAGPHLPPTELDLVEDARELWLDFAQEVENALAPGGELDAISDWGAKLAGTAARIALLFELVTSGAHAERVCADSVQAAVALCRLLIRHARAAFRLLAADEADRDADAVMGWVTQEEGRAVFKQSELHMALHGRFTKKERLTAALIRLQANGCLRHESRKNKGARPTDFWHVNPRLFLQ